MYNLELSHNHPEKKFLRSNQKNNCLLKGEDWFEQGEKKLNTEIESIHCQHDTYAPNLKLEKTHEIRILARGNCLNFLKLSAHFLYFFLLKKKLQMERLTFCIKLKCFIIARLFYTVQNQNNSVASREGGVGTNEDLSIILECPQQSAKTIKIYGCFFEKRIF